MKLCLSRSVIRILNHFCMVEFKMHDCGGFAWIFLLLVSKKYVCSLIGKLTQRHSAPAAAIMMIVPKVNTAFCYRHSCFTTTKQGKTVHGLVFGVMLNNIYGIFKESLASCFSNAIIPHFNKHTQTCLMLQSIIPQFNIKIGFWWCAGCFTLSQIHSAAFSILSFSALKAWYY